MSDLESELQVAIAAVRHAAALCQRVQSQITPDVLEKRDRSPVTIADFASQAIVCHHLRNSFPNDPIIGEEDATELRTGKQREFLGKIVECVQDTGLDAQPEQICDWIDHAGLQDYQPRFWTLDPIDGTKGFLRKGQYAISLALIIDGQIQLGVLGCPNYHMAFASNDDTDGTLFFAVRGQGASAMSLAHPDRRRSISVTNTADPAQAIFCESVESGHSSQSTSANVAHRLGIQSEPVRLDSQAKYAAVACGQADIYMRLPTRADYQEKVWDHAGGAILVEEAGGTVTDIHGQALDWTRGSELNRNSGVLVSNGQLHKPLTDALSEAIS